MSSWGSTSSGSPHAGLQRGDSGCWVPCQAAGYCSLLWQWVLSFCRAASLCSVCLPGYSQGMGRGVVQFAFPYVEVLRADLFLPEIRPRMMKSCSDSPEVTTPHLQMEHHNIKHPCVVAPVLKNES